MEKLTLMLKGNFLFYAAGHFPNKWGVAKKCRMLEYIKNILNKRELKNLYNFKNLSFENVTQNIPKKFKGFTHLTKLSETHRFYTVS